MYYTVPIENFWPENISDELKNSTIIRNLDGWDDEDRTTFNITCSNCMNIFDFYEMDPEEEVPEQDWYLIQVKDGLILFNICLGGGTALQTEEEYIKYADLTFTISMAE